MATNHGVIIPWCWGKLGRKGYFVDNAAAGGLLAGIDVTTGKVIRNSCCDEFGQRYTIHPDSGIKIEDYTYPGWKDMLSMCREMAQKVPAAKWIGWDMAHTDSGWVLVEGNSVTEVIGPQSTSQSGIRSIFDSMITAVNKVY